MFTVVVVHTPIGSRTLTKRKNRYAQWKMCTNSKRNDIHFELNSLGDKSGNVYFLLHRETKDKYISLFNSIKNLQDEKIKIEDTSARGGRYSEIVIESIYWNEPVNPWDKDKVKTIFSEFYQTIKTVIDEYTENE